MRRLEEGLLSEIEGVKAGEGAKKTKFVELGT